MKKLSLALLLFLVGCEPSVEVRSVIESYTEDTCNGVARDLNVNPVFLDKSKYAFKYTCYDNTGGVKMGGTTMDIPDKYWQSVRTR